MNEIVTCVVCNKEYHYTNFYNNYKSRCKFCSNKVVSKLRSTEPSYHFKHITELAESRAILERFKEKEGDCEIDFDYIYFTLLDKQHRRCPITNVPLSLVAMSHWQASVDRINDGINYTLENSRLIPYECNTRSKWYFGLAGLKILLSTAKGHNDSRNRTSNKGLLEMDIC
ncbi:hypothetical protein PPL_11035 [Heterostelium album PN500]|uniref:Uncharacterized protein n=1 Tax=Heterostelium pallidum (strain ATCC 26659 / Pp 5 / PN500) TaxID=670386 RepID=D3BSR6_HETP5|nr:hypothetical protein PPL_11035 [Heterostelium album PN500]EFA75531.1 hypothetical protein PPL_11035 [Heterostelium album PN500]|eukprot:XP_020427665.1 hypothetical protein PPL_11035 [Heterostelium album PN500]